MKTNFFIRCLLLVFIFSTTSSCIPGFNTKKQTRAEKKKLARTSMFIGVDISGSFRKGGYYKDAMRFLAIYIKTHLEGYGQAEVPKSLFVGSIGGSKYDESKTFFPIQTFQDRSIASIEKKLHRIFPKTKKDQFTDFNSYFKQVENFVRNKNMVLRPLSIILMSDGKPNVPKRQRDAEYRKIDLSPLENLARSVTIRLLYTDPVTAEGWQSRIKRQRVRIWTQDAVVMKQWKQRTIFKKGLHLSKQKKFFDWLHDNVDFGVRVRKVD